MADAVAAPDGDGVGDAVWVDAIGVPARHDGSGPVAVAVLGAGDAIRRRITDMAGFTLAELPGGHRDGTGAAEDPEGRGVEADGVAPAHDAAPDVVLVSTRLPRTEAVALVGAHRESFVVVALVHTGGESLAADLLRAGASGLLAEGNEAAVRSFLTRGGDDTGLLEVYDRQVGRSQVVGTSQHGQDPVTGLPNAPAFDSRVAEAQLSGDVPRIGFARLLFLQHGDPRASTSAATLVRRRFALQLLPRLAPFDIELYAVSDTDFAFIGPELSPHGTEQLAAVLATAAGAFAPWGHPLAVAVGHAGPEVSQDPAIVRQLAERAVEVAALEQCSTVVGAETLALGASSTTELEAALRLVDVVERHDPQGPGHAARVAELAGLLAWELGYQGRSGAAIRLAAHLHDIGKVGLPKDAMFPAEGAADELVQAARSHPVRAADYLRPLAGPDIAVAVRGHHERWDGTGYPDGLAGEAIPVPARIVAVVADYVRTAQGHGHAAGIAVLSAGAGTAYDPAIVEAATTVLHARAGASGAMAGVR